MANATSMLVRARVEGSIREREIGRITSAAYIATLGTRFLAPHRRPEQEAIESLADDSNTRSPIVSGLKQGSSSCVRLGTIETSEPQPIAIVRGDAQEGQRAIRRNCPEEPLARAPHEASD